MILAQIEPFEDICVPGLDVDGESARPLISTLIDVPGRLECRSRLVKMRSR